MFFKDKKCSNCETYYDETLNECPKCHKNNELFALNRLPKHVVFLHPVAQIGLFLAGFSLAGMLLAELFFANIVSLIPSEDLILKSTVLLFLTYAFMLGGLASIVFLTRKNEFLKRFKQPVSYLYGLGYAITIICVSVAIGAIISLMYTAEESNVNQATAIAIAKGYPFLAYIILGLIGPICEELTYRVGLYSFLRRINKYLAFAVTVAVFAFIHFDYTAEDIVNELWSLPSYLAAGFLLTLAYEHRGPSCSILAHVLYNSFAFVMMLVQK